MHARYTVITDVAGSHDFAVGQVVGVAEFQIRFVDNYFLVKTGSVGVYFVDLPVAVFIEGGEKQAVGIPVQLDIREGDICCRFIDGTAFDSSPQIG